MVTTVGTDRDVRSLVENMITLEHLAIADYTATIERQKQVLTTGKVKLATLVGGFSALLKARGSSQNDAIQAYRQASGNGAVPAKHRPVFRRGLEDERRHQAYMGSAAQRTA